MRGVIMAEKKKKPYEIGELDQYLFGQGNHYEIYKKLGAHLVQDGKQKGVYFAVWAPNAVNVSVVGEFNNWIGFDHKKVCILRYGHRMHRQFR